MVVDSLFLCVCEDRNINGDEGRWKSSGLAELGGDSQKRNNEGAELQNLQNKYWTVSCLRGLYIGDVCYYNVYVLLITGQLIPEL